MSRMAGRLSRFFKAGLSKGSKLSPGPPEPPQISEGHRSVSPPRPPSSLRKIKRTNPASKSTSMIYSSRSSLTPLSSSCSPSMEPSAAPSSSTPIVVVGNRSNRSATLDPGGETGSSFPSSVGRSLTTDTSDLSLSCSREEITETTSLSALTSHSLHKSTSDNIDLSTPSRSRSTSIFDSVGDLVPEVRRRKSAKLGGSQILLGRTLVRRESRSEFDAPPSPTWTSDKLRKLDMLLNFPIPYLLHILLSFSEGDTFSTRIADYLVERGDFYAVFYALLSFETQLTDTNFLRENSPATRLIQRLLTSRLRRSFGDRLLRSQQWKRYTQSQKSAAVASGSEDGDEIECIGAVIDYILTVPNRVLDPAIALCLIVSNWLANRHEQRPQPQPQPQQEQEPEQEQDQDQDQQQPSGPLMVRTAVRSPIEQLANSSDAAVSFSPAEKVPLINYAEMTVSSVLFLRFLCPLLVSSTIPGLPPTKARVKMAKILQTLANGSTHPNPMIDELIQRKRLDYLHFSAQLFVRGFDHPNHCFSLPPENRDALKPLAHLIAHHRAELIALIEAPATWSSFDVPPPALYLRSFLEIIAAL